MEPASPLARKLKLKPGLRAAVIGAPAGYLESLDPPADVTMIEALDGPLDWVQVFVRTLGRSGRDRGAARAPRSSPTGLLWISYPKGASKIQTDLTRDKGWEPLADSDLMWLSLVSIDATWSAFSLRPYKPGEARQTFR